MSVSRKYLPKYLSCYCAYQQSDLVLNNRVESNPVDIMLDITPRVRNSMVARHIDVVNVSIHIFIR